MGDLNSVNKGWIVIFSILGGAVAIYGAVNIIQYAIVASTLTRSGDSGGSFEPGFKADLMKELEPYFSIEKATSKPIADSDEDLEPQFKLEKIFSQLPIANVSFLIPIEINKTNGTR